jgi:hypothetical protein
MNVISQLATALGRRDEVPNQELARKIAKAKDKVAVKALVENLKNKDKNIQADCIKVLYEIGGEQPSLIKDHIRDFEALLNNKNNRLVWGGMIALNRITDENPEAIYQLLPKLIDAANKGSVITRDNLVSILIKLEGRQKYTGKIFPLLLEQMTICPTNQLPMYAENAVPVIHSKNKSEFLTVLQERLPEIETDSKRNRILKVISKVGKAGF